jgi:hypothetical protein
LARLQEQQLLLLLALRLLCGEPRRLRRGNRRGVPRRGADKEMRVGAAPAARGGGKGAAAAAATAQPAQPAAQRHDESEQETRAALLEELELAQAMFSPDELSVSELADGSWQTRFSVLLEHALVELSLELPRGFPLARGACGVRVLRSRGLVDSQEQELCAALELSASQREDAQGRFSLSGLLLRAREVADEQSVTGGCCAVCLSAAGTGEDEVFRAQCWHVFHASCLAAWWRRVEDRRSVQGSEQATQRRQRQQQLSAAQARQSAARAVELSHEQRAELLLCQARAALDEAAGLRAAGEPAAAAQADRRAQALQADAKRARQEEGVARQKTARAADELALLGKQLGLQEEQSRQGLACPLCRNDIAFVEIEPFLDASLGALASVGEALVPLRWAAERTQSPVPASQHGLTPEAWATLERMRLERERLYAVQLAKGAFCEASSKELLLTRDAPTASAGAPPAAAPVAVLAAPIAPPPTTTTTTAAQPAPQPKPAAQPAARSTAPVAAPPAARQRRRS